MFSVTTPLVKSTDAGEKLAVGTKLPEVRKPCG